jgi:hypothetical protein
LVCSRSEGDGVLEIGKKHAFSNKSEHVERGRTHFSEMRLDIRRRSALTDKGTDRLKLDEEKIGELGFFPPHEKSYDVPAFPATLEAYVFVSDTDFESALRSFANGTAEYSARSNRSGKSAANFRAWDLSDESVNGRGPL